MTMPRIGREGASYLPLRVCLDVCCRRSTAVFPSVGFSGCSVAYPCARPIAEFISTRVVDCEGMA